MNMSDDDDWADFASENYRGDARSTTERKLVKARVKIDHLEEQLREVTAVAAEAMETLAETGQEDFVLIKAPKVRKWWSDYREAKLADAKFWVDKTREETLEHKEVYDAFQEVLDERIAEYDALKAKYKL